MSFCKCRSKFGPEGCSLGDSFQHNCTCKQHSPLECKFNVVGEHVCACREGKGCFRHNYHECICDISPVFCLARQIHECTCKSDKDTCRAEKHICSCPENGSGSCRCEDKDSHGCSCMMNVKECRSRKHICICSETEIKEPCRTEFCKVCTCVIKGPRLCTLSCYAKVKHDCTKKLGHYYMPRIDKDRIIGSEICCFRCDKKHYDMPLEHVKNLPPEIRLNIVNFTGLMC